MLYEATKGQEVESLLNQRRVAILRLLLADGDAEITVTQIATEHGVSERLVRYDMAAISEWAQKRGGQVTTDPRRGLHIAGDTTQLGVDLRGLAGTDPTPHDYVLSPDERRDVLITALLSASDYITMASLAERLWVSRATIYGDIDEAQGWLTQYDLVVDRRPHAGVRVLGAESGWRRAACALLTKQVGPDGLAAAILDWETGDGQQDFGQGLLPLDDLRTAFRVLRAAEQDLSLTLADASFAEVALYLAVATARIREGRTVQSRPADAASIVETREWPIAMALMSGATSANGGPVPEAECAVVTQLLQQASSRLEQSTRLVMPAPADLRLAAAYISRVESLLGVDLRRDPELTPALALHLRPIQFRLGRTPPIQNPLLNQIQDAYPDLYRAATTAAELLQRSWGYPIPDAEIGYLTMHLGAALERIRWRPAIRSRALVVCGTGIGTARLLASRLQAMLPELELVGLTSVLAVDNTLSTTPCDLIISACPVPVSRVPVVQVSPLLLTQDVRAIRRVLEAGGPEGATPRKGHQPMLAEVLTPETIRLDVAAATWEDAVRHAGAVLIEAGAAEPRYADAMVESVRRIGPYIVIAPGIALPHARPEDGVLKVAIALLRLTEPVRFGHEANDPVDLVFALAAVDTETHLKALTQLSALLSSETGVQDLRAAADVDGILRVLSRTTL